MADLTVTGVMPLAGAANAFADLIVGEAVNNGDWVYRDSADSYRAKIAGYGTAATANVVGLALHATTTAGQPLRVQTAGRVTLTGPTLDVGMLYVLGTGTDNFAPVTDVDSGEYVTLLGIASTTSIFDIKIWVTGILSATNI